MKARVSCVATRTGDTGMTSLGDGARVRKDDPRIEALGAVDELNSWLGVVIASLPDDEFTETLAAVQQALFDVGGELALPGREVLGACDVEDLDAVLAALNGTLPPLEEFILPGGSLVAAHCHLARTTARRLERRLVTLDGESRLNPAVLAYVNRLSDVLFVLARTLTRRDQQSEPQWQPARRESDGGGQA